MDFEDFFNSRLAALKAEGRYRVFTELERRAGAFPTARHHLGSDVTVWCSDLLAADQLPDRAAGQRALALDPDAVARRC